MKVKLNTKQIAAISREIRENDRKTFSVDDVSEIFRMLQYWMKSYGTGEEAIKSVTELPDGYLCRVNRKFHDSMKGFLRDIRSQRLAEELKDIEAKETLNKYEQLIQEAEERGLKAKRRQ